MHVDAAAAGAHVARGPADLVGNGGRGIERRLVRHVVNPAGTTPALK